MLYWTYGPIWFLNALAIKALSLYNSSKIKYVDRQWLHLFFIVRMVVCQLTTLLKRKAAWYSMSPASLISLIHLQGSLSSLSVPLFGDLSEWVFEQRLTQGLQSLCCNWKEDQGSPCKNIPMVHLPPALIPARNFPTHYRAVHIVKRGGTEKVSKWHVGFFSQ